MLAASEASAEAAIQLPAIGADGWDDTASESWCRQRQRGHDG